MRSLLFKLPLDGAISLGPLGELPVFGFGLLLALWAVVCAALVVVHLRRGRPLSELGAGTLAVWVVIALAIFQAPRFGQLPIFGFGAMLMIAFMAAAHVAGRRLAAEGVAPEVAIDATIWVVFSGVLGARLFYIAQYHQHFFGYSPLLERERSLAETLVGLINLPDGGLVLYGGFLFTPIAYYIFTRRQGLAPLALADIIITSVFIGLAAGRIGCLLHGCCYGDVCSLPWAISFPPSSAPFRVLVERGLLSAEAVASLPLHPTQVYDAINGLLLALFTWSYYPFRRRSGEVLAVGLVAYPINRFLIEILRFDEQGKFGTSLTISQWGSIALVAAAAGFLYWLSRRPPERTPLAVAPE
jgi:phosphatidylglycerol---prolipoprotein diacylglyceryl transferase